MNKSTRVAVVSRFRKNDGTIWRTRVHGKPIDNFTVRKISDRSRVRRRRPVPEHVSFRPAPRLRSTARLCVTRPP